MRLAASRTGQILSLNTFASDIGVSPITIKSWLAVLEASQIIYLLEPFYENLGKRLVKTPKLYFLDTGLACFLSGFRNAGDLAKSTMLGAMFETLALGQIVRKYANRGMEEQICFYRDHQGIEVDFVIPVGRQLKLYECKVSEDPGPVKAFQQMERFFGTKRILSKTVLTPLRGHRKTSDGTFIEDCVDLKSLEI